MYKEDLALNNLQGLIYHKTQPTNQHQVVLIVWNFIKDKIFSKPKIPASYHFTWNILQSKWILDIFFCIVYTNIMRI